MNRRAFLGALASGGAVALAGCTAQRETLHSLSATPEIASGGFYHEPLLIDEAGKQFNLQYEVTADHPFDIFLFGGQSDAEEFGVYRRAVRATGACSGGGSAGVCSGGGSAGAPQTSSSEGHTTNRLRNGPRADSSERGTRHATPRADHPPDRGPGRGPGGDSGDRSDGRDGGRAESPPHPEPSNWHSVVGTTHGEVNRPLHPGIHHFVVDNTAVGPATPDGTLRPTIDLAVRDFEPFSG